VNGSIQIRENAVVGTAHAVNGSISLASHASAAELQTVNGPIELAAQAKVSGKVHTVNGKLSLADGSEVGGALVNVNGAIKVAAAHVGGGIDTVSGGIELGPNAHVEGGIHVRKPGGFFNLGAEDVPRIVIGPGSVVGGTLNFERPVKLYVSDKATIGRPKALANTARAARPASRSWQFTMASRKPPGGMGWAAAGRSV
jgi:hypothetical protein